MKTLALSLTDIDSGEPIAFQIKVSISGELKQEFLYSLYQKLERDWHKYLWTKELANNGTTNVSPSPIS
jgi:hypothetical protein